MQAVPAWEKNGWVILIGQVSLGLFINHILPFMDLPCINAGEISCLSGLLIKNRWTQVHFAGASGHECVRQRPTGEVELHIGGYTPKAL